jgi:hypothetical protein
MANCREPSLARRIELEPDFGTPLTWWFGVELKENIYKVAK